MYLYACTCRSEIDSRGWRFEEGRVMNVVNCYFAVSIFLAVIGGVVLVIFRRHKSLVAERRIQRMMVSCGIDTKTVANAGQLVKFDMDAARTRCRHCPVTNLCERWLDGEAVASNRFCPNACIFLEAAGSSQT